MKFFDDCSQALSSETGTTQAVVDLIVRRQAKGQDEKLVEYATAFLRNLSTTTNVFTRLAARVGIENIRGRR